MHKNKIYFENLNAIRFIAAFLVIICHIEELKDFFGIERVIDISQSRLLGKVGVVLFFVLSGFLISYLLFKEKEVTNTISVKKFYIRRILRIWPLYFLIVFFTFFIVPFVEFFIIDGYDKQILWFELPKKILLYVAFLPNLACAIYGALPYVSITWSIGVEEQFYLLWPWLNKKIKNKWTMVFSIIIGYFLIKRYMFYLPHNVFIVFKKFWAMVLIDCMAIGGIFAILLYQNNTIVNFIKSFLFKKTVQWVVMFLVIFLIYNNFNQKDFYCEIYSILFGILILNFAANPDRIFSMENKVLNYLGKISYGIYMYHYIFIIITLKFCENYNIQNNFIYYTLSTASTILIASISYKYFEKRFIDKKLAYSDIISGDNAKVTL